MGCPAAMFAKLFVRSTHVNSIHFLNETRPWNGLVERRYDLEHVQAIRAYDDSKMIIFSHDPWMDTTKLALHQGRPVVVATNRSDVASSDF